MPRTPRRRDKPPASGHTELPRGDGRSTHRVEAGPSRDGRLAGPSPAGGYLADDMTAAALAHPAITSRREVSGHGKPARRTPPDHHMLQHNGRTPPGTARSIPARHPQPPPNPLRHQRHNPCGGDEQDPHRPQNRTARGGCGQSDRLPQRRLTPPQQPARDQRRGRMRGKHGRSEHRSRRHRTHRVHPGTRAARHARHRRHPSHRRHAAWNRNGINAGHPDDLRRTLHRQMRRARAAPQPPGQRHNAGRTRRRHGVHRALPHAEQQVQAELAAHHRSGDGAHRKRM